MNPRPSNGERWLYAEPFRVTERLGYVPAVRCPNCHERVVDTDRSKSLHATMRCPALVHLGDAE